MALVFGSIGAGVILLVSMYISIVQISADILYLDSVFSDEPYELAEKEERNAIFEEPEGGGKEPEADVPWPEDDQEEEYEEESYEQYYDFHNEIKTNLSYQVEIVDFEGSVDENGLTYIYGNYPLVICEDKNKEERINSAIQAEMQIVSEHVSLVGEELPEDMYFIFEMESYVTYMDEDILSVIYEEYAYLDDEMYESYVVSVNFDMGSGMQMTNSQILDIDDEFSIDFRERNERQNGQIDGLEYYSDQDITEMLNDDDYLIIFYTPLGMEVGINYYFGWVTVTYTDYEKFSNPF